MTVVGYLQNGSWLEYLETTIVFAALDTSTDSAVVPLSQPGHVVGFAVSLRNLPSMVNGTTFSFFNSDTGTGIQAGQSLSNVKARGIQRLAPATTATVAILLIMTP